MGWDMNHSYRVPGTIYPSQHIVQFDLSKAFQYEADTEFNLFPRIPVGILCSLVALRRLRSVQA